MIRNCCTKKVRYIAFIAAPLATQGFFSKKIDDRKGHPFTTLHSDLVCMRNEGTVNTRVIQILQVFNSGNNRMDVSGDTVDSFFHSSLDNAVSQLHDLDLSLQFFKTRCKPGLSSS